MLTVTAHFVVDRSLSIRCVVLDGRRRAAHTHVLCMFVHPPNNTQAAEAQPMPTSLEGFKRHPKFVLERHLG